MNFHSFFLSPEKYRTAALLGGIILLSLFLHLISWFLEPAISRDGIFYLELVQVWHNREIFRAS